MTLTDFVFILELIGTIAFSVSGVMTARACRMDVFGAVILGCTAAVGGGVIRDLILGITPPAMFTQPVYVLTAAITALMFFVLILVSQEEYHPSRRTDNALNVADTLGLAAFVAVGTRKAFEQGFGDNLFLCVFVGCLTGVGGGILRDILANQTPLILRRHVYGMAAVIGSLVYCWMYTAGRSYIYASLASMTVICLVRYLAIHFRLNLPAFK